MEAQATTNGDSTANGAPQPQRERKPPRPRGEKNGQSKTFYKNDGEDTPSESSDKQDKKAPRTNGTERKPKQKRVEKKKDENEVAKIIANERFDNSSFVDSSEGSKDPHRALQISEATRLQEIVPSGVSKEVQEKVKRIQEVIGDLEFHVVYGALEDLGYDEEKTVSFFLDKKPAMVKREPARERRVREREGARNAPQTNQRWTSIVKKGLRTQYGVYDESASQQEPEVEEYSQQPQQQPRHRAARNGHSQEASQPTFAQRVAASSASAPNGQSLDSETLVTSLTMAIASQLKMIQEQTQMLTAMQNELANITQTGSSEKEQLLNEQERLRQREVQLLDELEDVRIRMEETDRLLAENQKKKVERLSSITQNNYVAQILRSQGSQAPPQPAPAAHAGDQHRPPQQHSQQQHSQQQHPQQQHPQQRERAERHQRDRWERTDKPRNQNRRNQDKYT